MQQVFAWGHVDHFQALEQWPRRLGMLGRYSIRINDQWRVCFRWKDGSKGKDRERGATPPSCGVGGSVLLPGRENRRRAAEPGRQDSIPGPVDRSHGAASAIRGCDWESEALPDDPQSGSEATVSKSVRSSLHRCIRGYHPPTEHAARPRENTGPGMSAATTPRSPGARRSR